MLKINLLPSYIYEKRKVRNAAFLFGGLFVVVVAGMLTWWVVLGSKERQITTQVMEMERNAGEVTELERQVQAEQAKIPPIRAKVTFIEDLMAYNEKVPDLYEDLAKYTYSRILYRSVRVSGNQLTVNAYSRSVGDCGRYLLNMYRASHVFSSVSISGVPGWASGGGGAGSASGMSSLAGTAQGPQVPGGFSFTVSCALVEPISAPTYSSGGAASAGGAPGAGGPGMAPGGPPS